jgi:hypothetical protein
MDFSQAASHLNWLAILVLRNLIAAASLAMFIGPAGTWQFGLIAGLLTGLTFISVALGVTYLFEPRPFSLFAINAGYQTVLFVAMGAILGAWR